MNKKAIVCGAGGFIGHHMIKRLKSEGYYIIGIDLKWPEFELTEADEFIINDLRNWSAIKKVIIDFLPDEVYQFAADMGGAGFVFIGDNDYDIIHNSVQINLNVIHAIVKYSPNTKIFFSSSACVYPKYNQLDPNNPKCNEDSAYPADPDSSYGLEKLFSERLYLDASKNYGIDVKIARFHNIYGPKGSWCDGREKSPAALCRKVIEQVYSNGNIIDVWGDGKQTRSFLYIDDCLDCVRKLMSHKTFIGPVNIGSEEMVSINQFAQMIIDISEKNIDINNISGPLGVRGRSSENTLVKEKLNWKPKYTLKEGIEKTYRWIEGQYKIKNKII